MRNVEKQHKTVRIVQHVNESHPTKQKHSEVQNQKRHEDTNARPIPEVISTDACATHRGSERLTARSGPSHTPRAPDNGKFND